MLHLHAHQGAGVGVLGNGAQSAAGLGARQHLVQDRDQSNGQAQADQVGHAHDQTTPLKIGVFERQLKALGVTAPHGHGQVFKHNQKPQGADQGQGVFSGITKTRLHVAVSETLDQQRGQHRHTHTRQRRPGPVPAPTQPMRAGGGQRPSDHARQHEQRGNGEVQKVEHANGQRERHGHKGQDPTEHQAIDDLL